MKTYYLVIVLLIVSTSVFGQNSYYWYKGEKVPLTETSDKRFILLEEENIESVLTKSEEMSWKIKSKGKDNTINTLIPFNKVGSYTANRWEIIENIDEEGSLPTKMKEQKFYSTPFFKTQNGEEIGLSHLFYVKLFEESDIDILQKMAIENSVKIIGKNRYMPLWHTLACTKYSKGNALEMANLFFASGKFDAAEPDLMVNELQCVNDTYFDDQWHLNNNGQYGGISGIDINMCDAWELTEGCNDIVVAVVDEGIELDHPDLLNMFTYSYDTETNSSPSIVYGPHGTACAGIIGAASDNNRGVAGVAPECQLMSVSNSMAPTPNSRQRRGDGINWAWHNGADVISNSWGSAVQYQIIDDAIDSALIRGRNGLGCVVVFASGNDNSSVNYPANSNPDIIAVGAMSPCGERKNPNSCDTEDEWGSNYGNDLDLVAPGVLIPTTDRQGNNGYNPDTAIHVLAGGNKINNDYNDDDYTIWFNGTSSACPHVAGVAALILSINPNLTQNEVRDIIESTCTKVGNYNYTTVTGRTNGTWDDEVGYGCLNAYAAVSEASGGNISGPDVVCTSNTTFSLTGVTSGLTIDWDCDTSVLTQVSNDDGSSYVVHANSSSTRGEGWVRVRIITSCDDTITQQKTVWVGGPDFTPIVTGNSIVTCDYSLFTEANHRTVTWSVYGPLQIVGPNYGYRCVVEGTDSGYGWVYATVSTDCGSERGELFVEVNCRSKLLSFVPNPATGETVLIIETTPDKTEFDETAEWDLEIYNNNQTLKEKKTKLKGNEYHLNTSGWKDGVYMLRVNYKNEILTGKLVVRR